MQYNLSMKNCICFIGARGGSKGVKGKNLRRFGEKPLIAHAIEQSINSKIFSHVIVSTEDKKIKSIAEKFGAEVPFMRPKKLATDKAAMGDVLIHGIKKLYSLGYQFDILVNRDCTAPFIRSNDIFNSIKKLKKTKCNAVFGVYKQHFNPYFNMMESGPKGFLKMSKSDGDRPASRQTAPKVYQLNGFFTYNVSKLLKYGEPVNMPKVLPLEIPESTGFMIDSEIEFKIAELMLKKKLVDLSKPK